MRDLAASVGPWSIPSTWAWSTTGEITDVIGGGTPSTTDRRNFDDGKIPWITPADLSGYSEKLIARGARNITRVGLENSGARLMPPGTVLFTSRAPIGYVAIAATELATNQGFKSFIPPDGLEPDYVYYYLRYAKHLAVELASGTTFLEISGAKAAQIPLAVAPTGEQKRIVREIEKQLTRLDAAVAALKRVQANLKRHRASVLKAACEGRLVPFTSLKTLALGDMLREPLINGRSPSASVTGTAILRLTAMRTDSIDFAEVRLGELSTDQERAFAVVQGDIFVSRGNGSIRLVGRASIVRGDPIGLVTFPDTMIRVRLNQQVCDPEYFLYLWNSDVVRSQIERTARTTAGIHKISQRDMEQMTVPLPGVEEQIETVRELQARLSVVERATDSVSVNLRRSDRLRQSTLKRAFEGKLVPQDPNDEPASMLLERIRAERMQSSDKPAKIRVPKKIRANTAAAK